MEKKTFLIVLVCLAIFGIFCQSFAGMSSDNYSISRSVLSGGGAPMSSESYQINSTLGQPSPLAQGDQNPYSDSYDLYPGFWYTIETAAVDFCECDLNGDGSCNILDWPYFIDDWGRPDCGTPPGSGNPPNDCECDLNHDGYCNILDWPYFIEDWGRTDCPL